MQLTAYYSGLLETLPNFKSATPESNRLKKFKIGIARVWALTPIILCIFVMLGATVMLPIDRVRGNEKVIHDLYLPHVPDQLDQYHWWMESPDGERTFVTLCADGVKPLWNEGQRLTYIRVRIEPDCLFLEGYDGVRDANHNIINDGGE